jgi:hypothetical protein
MVKKKIKLGDKVEDEITGLVGIAVSKTEFLNGCTQFQVQPQGIDKDGKIKESEFIDEQQLKIVKEPKPKKTTAKSKPGGGFRKYPK